MDTDREIVARQIGREPRAFGRVAVRCPFGRPAVTEQAPYDPNGEPFPTTYYLTCRHLVAAVSRLEAAGGVERWSAAVAEDEELHASRAQPTPRARDPSDARRGRDRHRRRRVARRRRRREPDGLLKCLHAHVAFALARPGYELGERIVAELQQLWPDACCS